MMNLTHCLAGFRFCFFSIVFSCSFFSGLTQLCVKQLQEGAVF